MATELEAVTQLSRDLGDHFASITTGSGTSTTLEDTGFADLDEDNFLTQNTNMTVHFTVADEERRIKIATGFTGGPPVTTLTLHRSSSSANTLAYTIHRLFSRAEKLDAVNQAVNLVWPKMFERIKSTVTTVANQMDYDVSSAGIYRDIVRQMHRVSVSDTEAEQRQFGWEMRIDTTSGAKKLHLYQPPVDAHTLNIYGHKKMALSDYTDGEDLLVVTARAGIFLIMNALKSSIVTDRQHLTTLLQLLQAEFLERLVAYRREQIPFTVTSQVYSRSNRSNQFEV